MRTFKEFPKNTKCPICRTSDNKECVLVVIDGTQEGFNAQAQPFHLDCIELTWFKELDMIAMKWKKDDKLKSR
jgi:hypothetical protein